MFITAASLITSFCIATYLVLAEIAASLTFNVIARDFSVITDIIADVIIAIVVVTFVAIVVTVITMAFAIRLFIASVFRDSIIRDNVVRDSVFRVAMLVDNIVIVYFIDIVFYAFFLAFFVAIGIAFIVRLLVTTVIDIIIVIILSVRPFDAVAVVSKDLAIEFFEVTIAAKTLTIRLLVPTLVIVAADVAFLFEAITFIASIVIPFIVTLVIALAVILVVTLVIALAVTSIAFKASIVITITFAKTSVIAFFV